MNRFASAAVAAAFLFVSGCQRPKEVREVARLSKPIVVGLQQSGAQLESRMGLHITALDQRAATLSAQEARSRAQAKAIERDFRLAKNEEALRKLAVIREGDLDLLADPLNPVRAGAAARRTGEATKIDLSALTKTVKALERLEGADRMTVSEIGLFVNDVNTELRKIEAESAAEAAAGTEAEAASGDSEAPSQPN